MDKKKLDECLRLLKNGNTDALAPIYTEMSSAVYAVALSILKDEGLAQDVMQDTFMKVKSSVNSYQDGTNPSAWILTIARNFALMVYRKRKKEVEFDPVSQDYMVGSYTPEYKDENKTLKQAMNDLNENERQVVILHVIEEYKHREIAEMLNKPLGTILWTYNKAIKKLNKFMKEKGAI